MRSESFSSVVCICSGNLNDAFKKLRAKEEVVTELGDTLVNLVCWPLFLFIWALTLIDDFTLSS